MSVTVSLYEDGAIEAEDPKQALELLHSALVTAGFNERITGTFSLGRSELVLRIEEVIVR